MSTAIIDLSSVGYLAGRLLRSPNEITRAAHTLGIVAGSINGVPHYTGQQAELLADYFRTTKGTK